MRLTTIASVILMSIALFSCKTTKSTLTYFEDITEMDSISVPAGDYSIKIAPDDQLLITVASSNPEAVMLYNAQTPNLMQKASAPTLPTYNVDAAGNILFPELGTIHVAGLTTLQLAEDIKTRIEKYVKDPMVNVKLVNFRVSVTGEVNTPGTFEVPTERFSIFDALAAGGDLTPYGDRQQVILIRENNGKRETHKLNLNSSEILSSPYYYLQQNDVVHVQPNDIREDTAKFNQNNSYRLQVISTVTSAASIIASLVIALTVK